jgi:transposase
MQNAMASLLFSRLLLFMGVPGSIAREKFSMPSSTCCEVGVLGACFPTICLTFKTGYHYFRLWRRSGLWERIHTALREQVRLKLGRAAQPSAGIIDSQSVKTIGLRGPRGYDAGKKIKGRKRHLWMDTQGFVLKATVHSAEIMDRDGVTLLLDGVAAQFPGLRHVWLDAGYNGKGKGKDWLEATPGGTAKIVQHPQSLATSGFPRESSPIGRRSRRNCLLLAFTSYPVAGSSRTPNHKTPESLRLTDSTPPPMLGISGLLNLLTWVEHRKPAQASPHEEGGAPCLVPHPTRLPSPNSKTVISP